MTNLLKYQMIMENNMTEKTPIEIQLAMVHLKDAISICQDNAYTIPSGLLLHLISCESNLKKLEGKNE